MNRKAIIFGIKGYKLTNKEKKLFKKIKPWGIILFSRNIKNLSQLKILVNNIKKTLHDKKYPILIDQEGGTVSRLNKIINLSFFSQYFFGELYNKDKKLFYTVYKIYIDKVCNILKKVGININTVPVLDVIRKKNHNFIGTRSFSENSKNVSELGKLCINLYKKNRIATVIKHIPGHGMTNQDSHYKTPIIRNNKKELFKKDFKPFKLCKSHFAMTAHVVYSVYDPDNTATHSKIIIDKVIRNYINFKGLLISDDISMKSLKYKLEKNATKALQSGCNLVLHCNGNISEMSRLAKVIPIIDSFTKKKTSHFYKFLG
jgi:beta-N-acetylhexosaminidase